MKSQKINEMLDRPIIQSDVLNFLRNSQTQLTGKLREIQEHAYENRMPIIPHETAVFLQFIMHILKPKNVLEVGTAIGFSAALIAKSTPHDTKILTIDRYKLMIERARENFKKLNVYEKVSMIEEDAEQLLPEMATNTKMAQHYDFIFLDCAKSKYVEFLPYCLKMLSSDGVIMIDDIFQAGTIFDDPSLVRHKRRKIYEGLNKLLHVVNNNASIVSTSLPLGDGILLISKK